MPTIGTITTIATTSTSHAHTDSTERTGVERSSFDTRRAYDPTRRATGTGERRVRHTARLGDEDDDVTGPA